MSPKTSLCSAGTADLQRLLAVDPVVRYLLKASSQYALTFLGDDIKALTGYTSAQFTQDREFWANRIHPKDRPRVLADLETLLERDRYIHEYRFQFADNSWHWIRDEANLVRDAEGEPTQIVGSWQDITDRRQTRDASDGTPQGGNLVLASRDGEYDESQYCR